MNNQLLIQILEPNNNVYLGYKHSNYFTTTYLPNFEKINKDNIKFTKEELRKLESRLCTGKSKSFLADSLYNKLDILSPLTQNNLLTEKFILRIIDILKNYKLKMESYAFNFTWVLNLKKLGYEFTEEMLTDLKSIGFNPQINLKEKINSTEVELITYFLNYNTTNYLKIKEFLEKNPSIVPKLEHMKYFYSIMVANYLDTNNLNYFSDVISLYELIIKHGYQVSYEDIKLYFNNIVIYMDKSYESGCNIKQQANTNLNIEKFIDLINSKNINFTSDDIKILFKSSSLYKRNKHYFYYKYEIYINILHSVLEKISNNKVNKLSKLNYFEYISFNNVLHNTPILFGKYKNLVQFLVNNNLLNITENCIIKTIMNQDTLLINYLFETNLVEPSDNIMNYACLTNNLELVKKLINYKYIPNIKNIYFIKNLGISTAATNILNFLLDNGLALNDELLRYLIKKNLKIADLDKYGINNAEYIKKIEDLSVRENKFPYDMNSKYTQIFGKLNNIDINEFDELLINFDTENKKIGLLNNLVKVNNIFLINYLKDKFKDIKPDLEVIHKNETPELYFELFDLKNS
jgi:hypothetical protein